MNIKKRRKYSMLEIKLKNKNWNISTKIEKVRKISEAKLINELINYSIDEIIKTVTSGALP